MPMHVLFVAEYTPDRIEVSDRLPEPRIASGYDHLPVPVHQGYKLTRLWVEADEPPILPDGDLTRERYEEWRAVCVAKYEDRVSDISMSLGVAGFCVDVEFKAVEFEMTGTALEAILTNVGPYPIGEIEVLWGGTWSPAKDSNHIGTAYNFRRLDPGKPKVLQPGDSDSYILSGDALWKCLSFDASLSPEHCCLQVCASPPAGGPKGEIMRFGGECLSILSEWIEDFHSRRQQ